MILGRDQPRRPHSKRPIALAVILTVALACAAAFAVHVNTYYLGSGNQRRRHAGFGRYGAQNGDGTPTISSDEQIDRTAEEIARMMGA